MQTLSTCRLAGRKPGTPNFSPLPLHDGTSTAKSNQKLEGKRAQMMHSTKVSLLGSWAGWGSMDKSRGAEGGEYPAHSGYKQDKGDKNV